MLAEVREIWHTIDDGRGNLELELLQASKQLCKFKVFPDIHTAQKYIQASIQSPKAKVLDYDDFNSIFCKGIFRHSVVSLAHRIEKIH